MSDERRHNSGFGQWMADFRWAINAMRVRRIRRDLGFSERIAFDNELRPRVRQVHPQHIPAVIAYPDAVYHITVDDVIRPLKALTK